MKNRRQWKYILIDPKYQLKYVFWISVTGLVLTAINATVFYWFIRENYRILVDMSPMEDEVKVQLYRELHQVLMALGGFAGFFIALAAFFGVILSHRTAGPMYHFKRVFQEVGAGKTDSRVHLRPRDDFQDVAEECNRMIDALVKRLTRS